MVRIESTKYDGSKHYRFAAALVGSSSEELRAYTPPGVPMDTYRGPLRTTSHALRVFWPDRHWNLVVRWRPDWSAEDYYVNVATPATWTAAAVAWTDLDLDVIWRPQDPDPLLDDADEFELHSRQWKYPSDLVERCWATVNDVTGLVRRRDWPFDGSLLDWRPGSGTPEGAA